MKKDITIIGAYGFGASAVALELARKTSVAPLPNLDTLDIEIFDSPPKTKTEILDAIETHLITPNDLAQPDMLPRTKSRKNSDHKEMLTRAKNRKKRKRKKKKK